VISIVVPNLRVEVVTGPTCYPAEGGFSALTAYLSSVEPAIASQLRKAAEGNLRVKVRCAMLEIEGRIGNIQFQNGGAKDTVAIAVDKVRHFSAEK
jgi:hypothetical protein